MKVVGLAQDTDEVVTLAGSIQPQVVVVDLKMPKGGGLLAIQQIAQFPNRPKLLAIRLGASAYLIKGGPKEELISAILSLLQLPS